MIRSLHVWLLRLHPPPFRQRFGSEMLSIFDQSPRPSKSGLLADGLLSLLRQWLLRPEFRREPAAAVEQPDGVPTFYLCPDETPGRSALMQGAILSLATFGAISLAVTRGNSPGGWLIGSHHPSHSHLLPVSTPAIAPATLDSEVKMNPDAAIRDHDPLRGLAAAYFRIMPVLEALDSNHDLVISAEEIAHAPDSLNSLDLNMDGKLGPEECGASLSGLLRGTPSAEELLRRALLGFMGTQPILAVLDADHDGEISASEIRNASAALKRLDTNYDGRLTAVEVLPDPVSNEVRLVFKLDLDGDRRISTFERSNPYGYSVKELLDSADRDHDGFITEEEVRNEIRRRADLDGDGVVTWEEDAQSDAFGRGRSVRD